VKRKIFAQLLLVVAVVVGVQWIVPRLTRVDVRFEVSSRLRTRENAVCVSSLTVELRQNGQRVKALRGELAASGPAFVYETPLHRGAYEAYVRLNCTNGDVADSKVHALAITDEATIHLRPSRWCDCGA